MKSVDHGAQNVQKLAGEATAHAGSGRSLWLVPLIVLVGASLVLTLAIFNLSGGREIADDAAHLVGFARNPFVLWGDYRAAGISDRWGSFPPLLPLVFGSLVYPWLRIAGDFWGFRLGVLSWSIVVLFGLYLVLRREHGISQGRKKFVLMLFALLPSVLGAIAFIPQEESYVSLYCIALYVAAKYHRWGLVFFLFVLAAFAGKYFLLVLAVPLALQSRALVKNLLLWGVPCFVLLAAYVWYHKVLFGLTPIVSYVLDPGSSISLWALLWNLGYTLDPAAVRSLSLVLIAIAVFAFCLAGRRSGVELVFLMAGTLYITLLCLSITVPAYVLWNVPLVLVCIALMRVRRHIVWTVICLFFWGVGEWGANFFRGVKLALDTARPEGKTALAKLAERSLGGDFPYHLFHVACIALVLASGLLQIYLLWTAGGKPRPLVRPHAS